MRNFYRDEPEWDAEENIDIRPIVAECHRCGKALRGSTLSYCSDTYYVFDEDNYRTVICEDCILEWIHEHQIKEK